MSYIRASASATVPTIETMILDQGAGTVVIWVKADGSIERRNVQLSEVLTACLKAALSSHELALLGTEALVVSSLQAVQYSLSLCTPQVLLPTYSQQQATSNPARTSEAASLQRKTPHLPSERLSGLPAVLHQQGLHVCGTNRQRDAASLVQVQVSRRGNCARHSCSRLANSPFVLGTESVQPR